MRAKLVENVFVGQDPKEKAIPYIDGLIKNDRVWRYRKSRYLPAGRGRKLEEKMWAELPTKVNASSEFYSYSIRGEIYISTLFMEILEAFYGINTLNTNAIFGDTLNVPYTIENIRIKGNYGNRVASRFAYLPQQKIILEWAANTTGTESDLRQIHFDYDHIKAIINK